MPVSPQITITPEDITFKSFDITTVSYTSSTATYTATGHTLSAGDIVTITGIAPDGYNGTYTISSVATNTFTIANATNTALTDQAGNVYWADATEYEYSGGQTVTYRPNDGDVSSIVSSALAPIETAVNGKNKIYRQSTAPSGSLVTGDVWFDTSNGNRQYYWNGTAWVDVQDTAIAAAASAATAAQSTADGKNKVYRQGSTPSGTFAIGDLWFDTANDNKISRWDGSSWVANTLGNNALASISANKLNAGSIDASVITVSNINAGNISTGYLAAARIQAASLDASVITAGTITASQIATGTITATQIAAGTITATQIAASTITVDKLVAGTLTGYTVQTSSGTTSVSLVGSTNSLTFKYSSANVGHIVPLTSNGVLMHYGATADGTGGTFPQMYVGSANVSMFANTSNGIGISTTTGTNITGNAYANGSFYIPNHITTGSAANCFINSTSGLIARSTASSQRYKQDIVNLVDIAELSPFKLLDLPVRAFRFKDGYLTTGDDREGMLVPGFIAEEVDAIYPVGADYNAGQVETWNDRMIIPAMLALIQDQDARIKALEGK
jgi:hypothetical protein